jgi:hypothetical protein
MGEHDFNDKFTPIEENPTFQQKGKEDSKGHLDYI